MPWRRARSPRLHRGAARVPPQVGGRDRRVRATAEQRRRLSCTALCMPIASSLLRSFSSPSTNTASLSSRAPLPPTLRPHVSPRPCAIGHYTLSCCSVFFPYTRSLLSSSSSSSFPYPESCPPPLLTFPPFLLILHSFSPYLLFHLTQSHTPAAKPFSRQYTLAPHCFSKAANACTSRTNKHPSQAHLDLRPPTR